MGPQVRGRPCGVARLSQCRWWKPACAWRIPGFTAQTQGRRIVRFRAAATGPASVKARMRFQVRLSVAAVFHSVEQFGSAASTFPHMHVGQNPPSKGPLVEGVCPAKVLDPAESDRHFGQRKGQLARKHKVAAKPETAVLPHAYADPSFSAHTNSASDCNGVRRSRSIPCQGTQQ